MLAFVPLCVACNVPPPELTVNVTGAFAWGLLFESLTKTMSGWETNAPGEPVWLFPLAMVSEGGTRGQESFIDKLSIKDS